MRTLRPRTAPLFATVVAVALGAALAVGCGGLFETALRLDAPPQRLTDATAVVARAEHGTLAGGGGADVQPVTLTERGGVPADVRARAAAVDGVASAVADRGTGAVAVKARAGVSPDELAPRLRAVLRGQPVTVLTGDDRGRAEAHGVAASRIKLVLLASIFGGMALIVMGILLGSIVSLAVEQRQREFSLLRTIGATPRQIRRIVVRHTMRPALLAAAAGAAAGPAAGRLLFDRAQDAGLVPSTLALHQGVVPIAAGLLAALAAARISAGVAAHRAGAARPDEAVGEVEAGSGRPGPVRLGLAALMAAGAMSCAVITMFMSPENAAATGGGTALAGAVACALMAPLVTERLCGRLSGLASRVAGVPGELAAHNVRARARRTGALVIPVVLVVAIAVANLYQQTTQADAKRSSFVDVVRADAVAGADRGLTLAQIATAQRAGAVSTLTTSSGWVERPVDRAHRIDPRPLIGIEPSALGAAVVAGSATRLRGRAVALPEATARDLGVRPGDRVGLLLGDGAHIRVEVVALLDSADRHGALVLPAALLSRHVTARSPRQLVVNGPHSRDRLGRAFAGRPDVAVRGHDALAEDFDGGIQVDVWITLAVVGVILAYAAISLVNALVAALTGRRRELTLLALTGASRRQLQRMLGTEAALIAVIGTIAGTAIAIVALIPLSVATAGTPLPSGPAWVFPVVVATVLLLLMLPTLVVFNTTLRQRKVTDVEAG